MEQTIDMFGERWVEVKDPNSRALLEPSIAFESRAAMYCTSRLTCFT